MAKNATATSNKIDDFISMDFENVDLKERPILN